MAIRGAHAPEAQKLGRAGRTPARQALGSIPGLKRPESPPPGPLPHRVCTDARGPAISPEGSARRRGEPGDPPRPQGSGGAASGPSTPFPGTAGSRGRGCGAGRPLALPRANSCGPGPTQRSHTHPSASSGRPQEGQPQAPPITAWLRRGLRDAARRSPGRCICSGSEGRLLFGAGIGGK